MQTTDRWSRPVAAWLGLCLALAYLPDVGRGFIADDYGWILHSAVRAPGDLGRLFVERPMGFYRPLVSLSFAVNEWVAGLMPLGYALVNLALVGATAWAIVALARALGFDRIESLFAAAVWTFNIHGVGMALTWISGRTSILATLFATLAATATVRGRRFAAGGFTLAALFSKEEPLLLPIILAAWVALDGRAAGQDRAAALRRAIHETWPSAAALGVYLAARMNTAALTPATAPAYYALSASPAVLGPNLLEYADRSMTFAAAALALGLVGFVRRVPPASAFAAHERLTVAKGLIWLVLAHAITLALPVRSDLYACLPSVGVALAAAACGRVLWRSIPASRRRGAAIAALVLPLLLLPVYRGRNALARHDALLSTQVVARLVDVLRDRPDLTRVEVYQHAGEQPSVASAIGGGLAAALELGTGRRLAADVRLTAPSDPWPPARAATLRLTVAGDEMVAVAPPQ